MKNFQITITGKTPLLMHHDNIEWADFMEEWKNDPANKTVGKAGDDRTPAWRWLGCLYHDGATLGIPQENIMRCLMEGGAMVLVPGAKFSKTFKSQTQSGMMCVEPFWPLVIDGAEISWTAVEALKDEPKFSEHKTRVRVLGFDLLVKRAKIGASKHVRVRPMFAVGWQAKGTLAVWDDKIDLRSLNSIFEYSGQYKGLGDWRPGGRTPGPFGTFEAAIRQIA